MKQKQATRLAYHAWKSKPGVGESNPEMISGDMVLGNELRGVATQRITFFIVTVMGTSEATT
jgi:hypothetical protein